MHSLIVTGLDPSLSDCNLIPVIEFLSLLQVMGPATQVCAPEEQDRIRAESGLANRVANT